MLSDILIILYHTFILLYTANCSTLLCSEGMARLVFVDLPTDLRGMRWGLDNVECIM